MKFILNERWYTKDLKTKAKCYDIGFEEKQNEHSMIEEILYIKLQKYETLRTLS